MRVPWPWIKARHPVRGPRVNLCVHPVSIFSKSLIVTRVVTFIFFQVQLVDELTNYLCIDLLPEVFHRYTIVVYKPFMCCRSDVRLWHSCYLLLI